MSAEAYITKYYYNDKQAATEPLFLSLLVGPGSFMYAISTNGFKNVRELCHVEITHPANSAFDLSAKISFLIHNYLLHQKKFEKVNASFLNSEFTMIPEAFASGNDTRPLLAFATGAQQVKRSLQHHVKNLTFCFNLDLELIGFFERTFPNVSIRHQGAVNISLFFSQHSLVNGTLYLNIGEGQIELAAKEKNELLFYNVFNYENNEDILYYLLFMMEQFQMNPLYVRLSVAGQRIVSDDLIKNIRRYIRQVDFCVTGASVNLSGELSSLPQHYYFTLLNQHLCEL